MKGVVENGINSMSSMVLLRGDLQLVFDRRQFELVPKGDGPIVVQFLYALPDLSMYHGQKIIPTRRLSGHCLFEVRLGYLWIYIDSWGELLQEVLEERRKCGGGKQA